jgi:hypothetical protein
MQTYTTTRTRAFPQPRNAIKPVQLLLLDAAVESPGHQFNVRPAGSGVKVFASVIDKDRATAYFAGLCDLLPWACTVTLEAGSGTVTINPVEAL